MKIGIIVRGVSELKYLYPIINFIFSKRPDSILYFYDAYRGDKEYDRSSRKNVQKYFKELFDSNFRLFKNNLDLKKKLTKVGVAKILGVELGQALGKDLKLFNEFKKYSLQYLIDSTYNGVNSHIECMDRVYYNATNIMNWHLQHLGIKRDKKRDVFLGHPMFDPITAQKKENNILVVAPNMNKHNFKEIIGDVRKFINCLSVINKNNYSIFKTRKKQYLSKEMLRYANEVHDDSATIYPTVISCLLRRSVIAVEFFSGSVYECVYGGSFVLNIDIPAKPKRQTGPISQFCDTSVGSLFNYPGVVKNVSLDEVIGSNFCLSGLKLEPSKREEWLLKFVGKNIDNGSERIAMDILEK